MNVGIESLNAYTGLTYIDIQTLFKARNLDLKRFDNLMMEKKSVSLPCEDPVSNAVNAAKPIIDRLDPKEKSKIELLITSTESGLDFGKSLSTYIHHYLGLGRECRLFEVKQACYGGTAALQMAIPLIASRVSPGSKALIVSTDVARAQAHMSFAEPSQGVGAIAMLVSDNPEILKVDFGSNGYYGFEIMDTCRPKPEIETGNVDLSLMTYVECLEKSFQNYAKKVPDFDLEKSFDYFAFHTPYAGLVKSAYRHLMRVVKRMPPDKIEEDFNRRVKPSLSLCTQVGNVYSASVYLALCGLILSAEIKENKHVGIYSYGSGCSSEFYSGIITPRSKEKISELKIMELLNSRYSLTMQEYDKLLDLNMKILFGIENAQIDHSEYQAIYNKQAQGKGLLMLKQIRGYHREYEWS